MVDLNKAKSTDVGKDSPNEESLKAVDHIVDGIVEDAGISQPKGEESSEQTESVKKEDSKSDSEADETSETSENESSEESNEEKGKEEEELIPKSKIQPRIDALNAKIKALEAQNQQAQKSKPNQEDKLNNLSVQELKSLRKQTKLAQRSEQDPGRYEQLLELEEKIEEKIQDYPVRFQGTQLKNLNAVLPELAKIDPEVAKGRGDLWNLAANIYGRSRSFQTSEMGQVEAMMLAAEHYSLLKSQANGKQTSNDLSRQVQNLKKKTSLDGKTRVAQAEASNLQKMREKARTGDMIDKENFFRDALIPEDFLQV